MKKIVAITILIFIISSVFSMAGATTLNNSKWNLYFENIKITDGSVKATMEPTITGSSKSEITYCVNLSVPGEFYEFTVDVTNAGTEDAIVSEVNGNRLTSQQEKYLSYEVMYMDGTQVKQYDKLKAGTTEKLRIRLEFKKDITADDLPKEDTTLTLSLNTYYVQADNNTEEKESGTLSNSSSDSNNSDGNNNKIDSNISHNALTGDNIIMYFALFILAILAILCIFLANRKKDRKRGQTRE